MNWRNVLGNAWLLCAQWVAEIMNMTAEESLGWRPPLEVLTGQTVDISILLLFLFWDVVYVLRVEDSYQKQIGCDIPDEIRCRFAGFAWDVGHAMTFKVLNLETEKILKRSRLRLANDMENNLKADTRSEDVPERIFIHSKRDGDEDKVTLPNIDVSHNPFLIEDGVTENGETATTESPSSELTSPFLTPRKTNDTQDPPSKDVLESNNLKTISLPSIETIDERNDDEPPPLLDRGMRTYDSSSDSSDDEDEGPRYIPITRKKTRMNKVSPMDEIPLKDLPTVDHPDPQEKLPKHLRDDHRQGVDTVQFILDHMKTNNATVPNLPPEELPGRTFLMPEAEDRSRERAKILRSVQCHKEDVEEDPEKIVGNKYDEIVAYNQIVDFIEQDDGWEGIWKFEEILDHQGPLRQGHKDYKGSKYNVLLLWSTGEQTWEPVKTITKGQGVLDTGPVTLAIYAKDNDLLDTPGWKYPILKSIVRRQKQLLSTFQETSSATLAPTQACLHVLRSPSPS